MRLINWYDKVFSGESGTPSSKRVMGAKTLFFAFILAVAQPWLKTSDSLIESFLWGGLALLGSTVAEKFANKNQSSPTPGEAQS